MRLRRVLFGLGLSAVTASLVFSSGEHTAHGAFPGGNGKIAFARYEFFPELDIYVMNPDGSGRTKLTSTTGWDFNPAWSPDGSRIAFVSSRDNPVPSCFEPPCNFEIYVMDADGSGVTRLTNSAATVDDGPTWSPDGSKIAFRRSGDIYVMNAGGSGQTNLTNDPASDFLPAWSPDGSKIAFVSHRDDNWEIYVMNAIGSGVTRLTNNPAPDFNPAWSPDGARIAFESERDDFVAEIYVMNADGSGVTRLTNNPAIDIAPAWSPDGTKIAFQTARDISDFEIYVMNPDGSQPVNLTDDPENNTGPDWQPLAVPPPAPTPGVLGGAAEYPELSSSTGVGMAASFAAAAGAFVALALGGVAWRARRVAGR